MIGHIVGDYGPRSNHRALADCDPAEYNRTASDGCAAFYASTDYLPVVFILQSTFSGCTRIQIVDEHHSVSHEYVIFDRYSFANKSMRRDLAAAADNRVLLNFDKGADLGFIANRTAVEIDQIRLKDLDPLTQYNISCDRHENSFLLALWISLLSAGWDQNSVNERKS